MKEDAVYSEVQHILMEIYPKGGSWTVQSEQEWENDKKVLLPKIISLYYRARKNDDLEMLEWVYYFARRIRFDHDHQKEYPGIVEHYKLFEKIQKEGSAYYLNPAITEDQRLATGQLYKTEYNIIMAGNIPWTGSSSFCSNCFEPISFGQVTCYCCKYPTIGPHGYPKFVFSAWKDIEARMKLVWHQEAFGSMISDILSRNLGRAWNDPYKELFPLYQALGIGKKMFGTVLD